MSFWTKSDSLYKGPNDLQLEYIPVYYREMVQTSMFSELCWLILSPGLWIPSVPILWVASSDRTILSLARAAETKGVSKLFSLRSAVWPMSSMGLAHAFSSLPGGERVRLICRYHAILPYLRDLPMAVPLDNRHMDEQDPEHECALSCR